MATIPSTPADGAVRVQFVPTIADTSAPTTTELGAAGAKDLSCYLTADGWTPGLDEATISDPRLCDTVTYERPGRAQRNLAIKYVENPTDPTNNGAYTTLPRGTAGFFVVRRGLPYSTAFAASQKVQVWPVQMGDYDWQPIEENSVLRAAQKAFVTGPVVIGTIA